MPLMPLQWPVRRAMAPLFDTEQHVTAAGPSHCSQCLDSRPALRLFGTSVRDFRRRADSQPPSLSTDRCVWHHLSMYTHLPAMCCFVSDPFPPKLRTPCTSRCTYRSHVPTLCSRAILAPFALAFRIKMRSPNANTQFAQNSPPAN